MPRQEPAAGLGRRLESLALTVLLLIVTLVVGWLVWSVFEWRNGRTPSYRLLGLRVVRRADGRQIGLGRSLVRSGICCPVLIVPTVVIGGLVGFCFAMGASPPDGLLRQPRAAPWDLLTATQVLDERVEPSVDPGSAETSIEPVGMVGPPPAEAPRQNGHVPG
jgi:RDD family